MATYYHSACHDCKEQVMWDKTSEEQAYRWHARIFKKLHPEHTTQFGNDYDDDFIDKTWRYKQIHVHVKGVSVS